ncbi:MAG: apolipoprotein N-acyltransferase, partial [Waddliaceae bacterium]
QLFWLISHPFSYIYAVWFLLSLGVGVQFGILGLFFKPNKILSFSYLLVISATWTLMEWARLFFMSGYSWNPVGLAFAGNVFSLQAASLGGVYALSFLVILTNLLALRLWGLGGNVKALALWAAIAAAPYLYGGIHYHIHNEEMNKLVAEESNRFSTVLVQPSFTIEESLCFKGHDELIDYVFDEWRQILKIVKKQRGKSINLIAFPELVVPFGAYTLIFPYEKVEQAFVETFGEDSIKAFPALELPLAYGEGQQCKVNHAFWVQAIANVFDAAVVAGLEDAADICGNREYYSSAIYVEPESRRKTPDFMASRYAKRVLVPMGEYIPFSFCKNLAAEYGVFGSFTSGKKAEVWECDKVPFGVSICYEETFGDLMRENRQQGARMLLNLTNDIWYPNSRLIVQHLEHARLRTVENGIPLVRACNTGVTCAVDSLGRDIAVLGDDDATGEQLSDSLYVQFPVYDYQTLYSRVGDGLIIGFSLLIVLLFFRLK